MIGHAQNLRVGNGAEQVADEKVEFRIGDEMSGLMLPQRATQDTGETEKGLISAGQAVGPAVIANQFTLNAKRGRLERNEVEFFERVTINRLTKHECVSSPITREH
jgi:hypothetical protein